MIIPELLLFLLPVAAAAGWFAASRSHTSKASANWDHSRRFHEDLGQLLSEKEADKQLFNSFTHANRDVAETYVALGNLYRRRGEFDRAIRIHQSLFEKQDLDAESRALARFELANDYVAAGLSDQAEATFTELINSQLKRSMSYAALLQLYEQQGEWMQAARLAMQCQQDTGESLVRQVAHYYCELANQARESGDTSQSQRLLEVALEHPAHCARANVLLADMALAEKDYQVAIRHCDTVEKLAPELMPVVIEQKFAALKGAADKAALKQYVQKIQTRKNAYSVIRTTRTVVAEMVDEVTADRFFKEQILKRPSLRGLRDWAHDQLALSKPDERDKVKVICNLLDQVMEDKPSFRCSSCGFQGNIMHWRCPGCASWDTVSTIIGVEGE